MKRVENIVVKVEISPNEQFLFLSHFPTKVAAAEASVRVYMWGRVNIKQPYCYYRPENIPWLYYFANSGERVDGNDVLRDEYLKTQYTFSPESRIEYRVARYNLNGEYIGLSTVQNGRIQICADTTKRLNAAYVFGTTYTQTVRYYFEWNGIVHVKSAV